MIQFPSEQAYQNAFQAIARKGYLQRMERVIFWWMPCYWIFFNYVFKSLEIYNFYSKFQADRSQWELLSPYNGKTVMSIFVNL